MVCKINKNRGSEDILTLQITQRERLYRAYRQRARDWFDKNGNWIYPGRPMGKLRENYWHCLVFLASNDTADQKVVMPILEKETHFFCGFAPFAAMQILLKHNDKLSDLARKCLTNYVAEALPKACMSDFQFHGCNDNMPSMKTFVLLTGGEILGEKSYIEQGLANLCQLRELLMRRGMLSEYNSPTYTPICVHAMAEIVNHVKNNDACCLALAAEHRIWAELGSHWHAATSGLAGPNSRTYTMDSVGHTSAIHTLMWMVLGDSVFINPLHTLFGEEVKIVLHDTGNLPFNRVFAAWMASADYHPPNTVLDYASDTLATKTITATTENAGSYPGKWIIRENGSYFFDRKPGYIHPATSFPTTTYLTTRWALGTSFGVYGSGMQSEVFYLRYGLKTTPCGFEDIRTIYARYLINEPPLYTEVNDAGNFRKVPTELLRQPARAFAFQKGGIAMACYGPPPNSEIKEISQLRLSILIFARHKEPDDIIINDQTVTIRDGGLWLLFRPMFSQAVNDFENSGRISVCHYGDWLAVELLNYDGPPRHFDEHDLLAMTNGFIFEVLDQPPDKCLLNSELIDTYYANQRRICYRRPGTELAVAYDPVTFAIRYASVDGGVLSQSKLSISGFDTDSLPWVRSDHPLSPAGFNWQKIIESRNM